MSREELKDHLLRNPNDAEDPAVHAQHTCFTFKALDGRDVYDGLPTDQSLYQRLPDHFSNTDFLPPSCLVKNPRFGGRILPSGYCMFVEDCHSDCVTYYLVMQPGKYRTPFFMRGHRIKLFGPFFLGQPGVLKTQFARDMQRIICIPEGKIRLIFVNGHHYPLGPGLYWIKSPHVMCFDAVDSFQDVIKKMNYTILRVPIGHFVCYQDVDGSVKELQANAHIRYLLRRGQRFLGMHILSESSVVYGEKEVYQRVFLKQDESAILIEASGNKKLIRGPCVRVACVPESFVLDKKQVVKFPTDAEKLFPFEQEVYNADNLKVHISVILILRVIDPIKTLQQESLETVLCTHAKSILFFLFSQVQRQELAPNFLPEGLLTSFCDQFRAIAYDNGMQFLRLGFHDIFFVDPMISKKMNELSVLRKERDSQIAANEHSLFYHRTSSEITHSHIRDANMQTDSIIFSASQASVPPPLVAPSSYSYLGQPQWKK